MANKPTYEELEQRVLELEKTETERKQVEEPEERLKTLSEASFEAIFLSEKSICLDQNQTAKRMFGYTRAEAIGRRGTEWIVPKDHEQVKNNMASGYEKPYKVTALKKDGDTFPAEIQARMTEYQGRSIRITALRDISDRKQAEEALYESEAKYKSLTNNLNVGVYRNSLGSKGKFIQANPAIVKMFGYDSREEFLKIGVSDLYKDPLERKELTFKIAKAGSIKNEILELQKKDGTGFIGSVSAVAVMNNNGDIKYFDGIIEDITERKRAEEALRESHKRYQLIVENISNVVWTMDMNFHNTFVSPSVYQQRGYTPDEIKNQPLSERMNPNSIEKVFNLYNEKLKLIEAGDPEGWKPIEFEIEQPCKDGSTIWTTNTVRFLPGPDKQPASLLGTTHDITERKQAEEALRESEERLNAILDATTETIVLFDSKGIVRAANQIVCERLETTKEEFIGRRIYDFFPPSVAEGRRQKWNEVFDTGKPVNFEDSRKGMIFEQRAYPILDDKGQVEMVVAFANDKTDSKLAKESLRESEEKFRLISEQSLLAIGIIQNGHILYANQTYSEITGYSLEEIYGWEPYEYAGTVYKDDLPFVMEQSRKKQAGDMDVITNYQFRGFTKAKEIVWWDLYSRTITYQERPADLFTFVDITERIESEKERVALQAKLQHAQKMEAIGTLAGGVAHDLNNILGGLVSYPELLLLQLPEDSPLRKSILTIQKSGKKAAAVVQDLLTLARRGVVTSEVVNLNDVVSDYLESPEHENLQSYHPGVYIDAHLEKDTLNILGSSTHLSKTVMNLISNAAEAMPEGGALAVSTENRYIDRPIKGYDDVLEGDYVILTVSDTGTGIAPDDLEKIFEPFYTKKKMGMSGTGLGMAVVWGTVKDHKGYIHVQSTEGKGTTFKLYFPVTRKSIEEISEISLKDYMGKGETILVVDDVEEQRNIASGMLKELGYLVASVSSGEEAVEYLKSQEVDLLVLDMIMDPGLDGLDTYKKILETHPGQKAIIASGFSETDRVRKVLSLGAGAYIRKPFLLEKIGLAVKEELKK